LRRLFSSSGGNHQEEVAEGRLDRFLMAAAVSTGFPFRMFFLFASFSFL
jgi:hypothetical protein